MRVYLKESGASELTVAYLTAEIAVKSSIPTYSGGLGILAGDTQRAAADLGIPMVSVTLLYPQGYARQDGSPQPWSPEKEGLVPLEERVNVPFEGRDIRVGAYRLDVIGELPGHSVPVYFLHTDVEGNSESDKRITDHLYDDKKRLAQFAILGIGGVLMLQRLGISVDTYHMNEGHSSLSTFEEWWQAGGRVDRVAEQNVFFNHTIVEEGMPKLLYQLVKNAFGKKVPEKHIERFAVQNGDLITNRLAAGLSRDNYGVSLKHSFALRKLFPEVPFGYVTNGVHPATWVTPRLAALYDLRLGRSWRSDPATLEKVALLDTVELWNAHMNNKAESLEQISESTGVKLEPDVFTVVHARRVTPYKRQDILFDEEIVEMLERESPGSRLQIIIAGKPHPNDFWGRQMLERTLAAGSRLKKHKVVFVPDYNMDASRLLLMAADVWLNTPKPGLEACGTSGMKAALNGIPHLSNPEGWWYEAPRMQGINGWTFEQNGVSEVQSLRNNLGEARDTFYRGGMAVMMPEIISTLGPPFHSTTMLTKYATKAWRTPIPKLGQAVA